MPALLACDLGAENPSVPLILAVNDNTDFLNLLSVVLDERSFRLVTAERGVDALGLAKDLQPDLIISDVVMPGIDGIELCRRLKADPVTSAIPVLLVTAVKYDEPCILEGLRAGACDFVPAYAPLELLRSKVEHLVAMRKRVLAARVETERQFRALIENSLDIVTILNKDGTIRYESPSVEDILGYHPEELIGQSAFKFIHPTDVSSVLGVFNLGVATDGYTARIEFRFRHKKGSWRVIEAIGKNLLNDPIVSGVIVNSRDVTERNQMQAAVSALDRRFNLAVRAVKDYAIFMLDPDGYIITWNAGGESIKGYNAEEIIGQHISRFYTSEDVETRKPYDDMLSATRDGSIEYEGWHLRKDGSKFHAAVVLTALRDDQGNLEGFLRVTRDVRLASK
jgi:PAS domain S-box-containing protein